ncbi:ABC transporter permease subunit [Deinococcus maricopensis]|jgi:arabinogalactan oligomer / maltooligosaccharide transport system permease protein|uniref:Maltose/maltodextrin transport system permease protein n=1 Tax=Deinococcus maricopensis (strain DSM 21211 / LMG 22137 / NRRL B-23946 / LB-34) TaxID=709986 RepID=E8U7L5_DEIML|nr:ABC transporter permease subunit [Deinococcus maricopensis]ADV67054.1 ABC-type transporter, integral membrane subunit [Deinococcus maricopensis DSM 21211]
MTLALRSSRPPEGARGFLIALVVLILLLGGSALLAWAASNAVAGIVPTAPPYLILVFLAVILAPAMWLVSRAFPWMMNWYYLVPAIVVLMAFTIVPIIMTVNFAFTNYSAQNSGYPDTSYKTDIKLSADRRSFTFTAPPSGNASESVATSFACAQPTCAGEAIVLYDEAGDTPITRTVDRVQGLTVTLTAPLATTFKPVAATRLNKISRIGLRNFQDIFARASTELWPVFAWTVVFAFSTIILNSLLGLILGILLFNKRLKFRNFYRTLLFLPWAIPTVISVQVWGGLFNQQFGAINKMLGLLGATSIPWLTDPLWVKIGVLLVNLWLGFPYMMTATISALSTISDDLYEAAEIDGASRWHQIRYITLPLLRSSFTPILLSGFAFNFNNFGIIYLLTLTAPGGAGGPTVEGSSSTAGASDILISWGYKTAFGAQGGSNYALASAIAMIVFFLTIAISLVNFRAAGVFQEARK